MATRKLRDTTPGEIVKIKENGVLIDFIVLKQGYPTTSYQNTLVIRKDLYNYGETSWGYPSYKTSQVRAWLNQYHRDLIDPDIRSRMTKNTIEYLEYRNPDDAMGNPGSGRFEKSTMLDYVFLLSDTELGTGRNDLTEGALIPYFNSNSRRIARYNGVAKSYYTRSPDESWDADIIIITNGGNSGTWDTRYDDRIGIRPAFCLNQTLWVLDDGTVSINAAPLSPPTITVPETIRGGEDTSIIWSAASDPDGNLDGYVVERSYNGGSSWTQIYQGRSTSTTTTIPFGTQTVMFRVQAYDTYGEKSGWTTSPNRVVINNHAPTAPLSISVPLTPQGGESLTVTWTASTDADGNLEGYELERQWDGAGAFTQIYKGAGLSYQDSIPKGEHTSVVYRVRAYDRFASYSSYTTSPSRTIDNNTAPVISCDLSGDLGEKSEGFSIPYTVSDAEQQEVTVTERVGNLVKRTYKATLNEQATFEITGEYFQRILNGQQTVQIVATDSAGKSSTLELTFTKAVHKAIITLSEPLAVEEPITVAVLAITGKIPADATQLIELTNNGNDPEPVWEDATADVKAGRNHPFTNKTQTNGWAFNFRVTVERGESGEDGNIVSIQGGFQ